MERTATGFRTLEDDTLLENVLQFMLGTFSSDTGQRGECPWDHKFGTPWEMLRHRNVRSGTVERYVAITNARVRKYMGTVLRLTAVERFTQADTAVRMRWYWRNVITGRAPEEPTDVEFSE
jgi:hypothetical protein